MSVLSYLILGMCIGSVISVFALVSGIIVDDKRNEQKHKDETEEAYKEGVIVGSRWKETEKQMLEKAMAELREDVSKIERRQA